MIILENVDDYQIFFGRRKLTVHTQQTQPSLFEEDAQKVLPDGLRYIPNFITPAEESTLLNNIDQQPWLNDLKRRVQHYGWKYDYTARRVDSTMRLGLLPNWLMDYCRRLYDEEHFPKLPDQVIINEYEPGQGIASHIDCVLCFEETIAALSLGSSCVMEFTNPDTSEKVAHMLEPRSLLISSGNARYQWKHGITARKTDKHEGQTIQRSRRISLTFRNVIINS
ncbi:MAG: alpha-ketoglutarate-dependent dioxygenase AlkB [Rickettsiales bacterium]|nr:alpha-ketoglutarate-dependent dioxygenase AlkB [Rickettsiales bacterium]